MAYNEGISINNSGVVLTNSPYDILNFTSGITATDAGGNNTTVNLYLDTNFSGFNNYYTQTQINTLLTGKSNTGHTHVTSDITNLAAYSSFTNYYTITQCNTSYSTFYSISGGTIYGSATVNTNLNVLGNTFMGSLTTPTAVLHLDGSTPSAGTAPLKFTTGTVMTTPEPGAVEYDGLRLFYTNSAATRLTLLTSAYGEIYESNAAGSTITSTPAGTFIGWTTPIVGSVKYTTYTSNATADRITILTGGEGDYIVNFNGSISCSSTRKYTLAIFKNGVQQSKLTTYIRSTSASTLYFSTVVNGILTGLVASDYLDVRVAGTNNNDAVTLYYGNLTITKINS
jgi:hypothetical protein